MAFTNHLQARTKPTYSKATLKAAHRKLDQRLLYWYAFVLVFMRTNMNTISNTVIMNHEEENGIKKELGNLSSWQWAFILSILYYLYLFREPLATLALKYFSPSVWTSLIMIMWATISMCQAAVQNYGGILTCRFLLGAAEAGYYPAALYPFSFWYPTDRLPLRIAFLYACGMSSGTVSRLFAYAISFMTGVAGSSGWRWLFILEDIPVILRAVVTWLHLPNYPETASFLNEDELAAIIADLPEQAPTMHAKTFDLEQVKAMLKAPTFIPFTMTWITHGVGGWGISFVLPTVIYELGISDTGISQVMTMPPFTLEFVILLSLAWFIHTKLLSPWIAGLGVELTQIVCYVLLITVNKPVPKYIFVMIATTASQSFFPIIWPERSQVSRGTTTAGLAIRITNASCQLMGIVGPQIHQPKLGPTYRVSFICSIALLAMCVGAVSTIWFFVMRDDKKRAHMVDDETQRSDNGPDEGKNAVIQS